MFDDHDFFLGYDDWNAETLCAAVPCDDIGATTEEGDVLAAARRFASGRAAAQYVSGDGALRRGAGAMPLDWAGAVSRVRSSREAPERAELARALGTLAQVMAHGDAMRAAGVVDAMAELLLDEDADVTVAAAEAIRHLACANQQNRVAAREAGAIPRLVAMLAAVAAAAGESSAGFRYVAL